MISDDRRECMEIEGKILCNGLVVKSCPVDGEQLEAGFRDIRIPEGIREVESGAFEEYNAGDVTQQIFSLLTRYDYHMNGWKKQLSRRQVVKFKFPSEIKTLHQKAEYMLKKEEKVRLMRLHLPKTCEQVSAGSFPVFLESIGVDPENEKYVSIDGVLFSRDKKTLIRYPGYQDISCYKIPDGVETIAAGAFSNAFVKKLHFPTSLKRIEDCAFEGISGIKEIICESEELSIGVGVFKGSHLKDIDWWCWGEIPKAAFLNADLEHITIPDGVISVEDYAFAGCYRAKDITISDSVQKIGPQSFDEGGTYDRAVKIPEHLYKYVYRFPARSKINGKTKNVLWALREDDGFVEEKMILERQKQSLEQMIEYTNFMQGTIRKGLRKQIEQIDVLLEACGY